MRSPFNNGRGGLVSRGKEAFLDFFENTFGKGSDSAVGVDIGSSAIKIVQIKKRGGKAILETYGELALGPYADLEIGQATSLSGEKISEALRDIIKEANVTAEKGGMAIPMTSSLVTIIELPRVSERRLQEMVPIEARRYIPVPISEVTLDWQVVPNYSANDSAANTQGEEQAEKSDGKEKTKILIAAIHNETISNYRRIAAQSGLAIDFLEIEIFSSIRSLVGHTRGTALILDMGARATKVSIVENGVQFASHIINRGSQDITQALSRSMGVSILKAEEFKREVGLEEKEKYPEEHDVIRLLVQGIFTEANRMLLDYEKRYNKTVGRVVLSGGGTLLEGILSAAEKNFDVPVEYADPFSKVETPAFLEEVLEKAGPNFAVALGVALRRLQELE